ncbi:hypothetical protein CERZMDRAFT_99983 [Cercospora zeae-maydis SCOH1-5]|uniref:NAD(P)-binding domain-containing protein n=1 Tax=Cercospora zeae-maydis SCOH1-5 TaxID=717836 RepID=A0A6A6F960_9PEZI|nr:hypothetical protein CERZMDRAFT_99983 [Cercospora zeae-maydis SCOH1-5]
MATTPKKTLAFFGATDGCAGTCLALALNAGYQLVRTPSNPTNHRTRDQRRSDGRHNVNGVGATPKLQWSLVKPVIIDQPTLCQDVTATFSEVSRELSSSSHKPVFINVSMTGIPSEGKPWDVPTKFTWMYRYVLQQTHEDKRRVQEMIEEDMRSQQSGIGVHVLVKPSLLMDGRALSSGKVRVDTEDQPEIGDTIRREDVGRFMFERLVKEDVKAKWRNTSLTITYWLQKVCKSDARQEARSSCDISSAL